MLLVSGKKRAVIPAIVPTDPKMISGKAIPNFVSIMTPYKRTNRSTFMTIVNCKIIPFSNRK